jgi:hypothetical protein
MGLSVTSDKPVLATVVRPDGTTDRLELYDRGRDPTGHGDDVPGDGIFTGVYRATGLVGAYQFLVEADTAGWVVSADAHEHKQEGPGTRFTREVRLSTAVNDPKVVETTPEDPKGDGRVCGGAWWCERYLCYFLVAILVLLLLNLWLAYRCVMGRRREVKKA